ncbi:fluoride exporter [Synechococcus sp. BIOS-U3-1]|uniref:fluoride efflux transporter FluC n=1 Tax=Synechococcus sp. BIOS-U3-1 TaxID=1400865 RepID=UPI001648A9E5|nr:CrcB family protein [Synechococcus sp. BIOS-U3-1]QNI57052.1 fluoride exporter [Synechococcus sp. BIOS-U3-1]
MPEQSPSLSKELQELVLVAVGAVPGALLRWQTSAVFHDRDVLVNVFGSLILGLLLGLPYRPRLQLLVGIGFCGSLTTFSSWMVNSVNLIVSGQPFEALGLIGMTLGLGLGGAALGLWIGRSVDALKLKPSEPPR